MTAAQPPSEARRSWGPFEAIRGLRPAGVLPPVTPIRRLISDLPTSPDPYAAAQEALDPLQDRILPGARIAVTAGSRGIHDLVPVVKAAVDWLTAVGVTPSSAAASLKLRCRAAASNARSSVNGGSLRMRAV